jgi:hypothetical protein
MACGIFGSRKQKQVLFLSSAAALIVLLVPTLASAQGKWNFPDRKAIVLDISPHVKITSFAFENTIEGRSASSRHSFTYQWKNISTQPVLALEIVTLKYDPFDESTTGSRTLVTGKNSGTPAMVASNRCPSAPPLSRYIRGHSAQLSARDQFGRPSCLPLRRMHVHRP